MSKLLIIYASVHHANTKKVLELAGEKIAFDMVSVDEVGKFNLANYECIGLASGIYMSKPHNKIVDFIESYKDELKNKKVVTVFTSGVRNKKNIKMFLNQMIEKGISNTAAFRCKGYDTFGPFRFIGGINKGHPNRNDAEQLVSFLNENVSTY